MRAWQIQVQMIDVNKVPDDVDEESESGLWPDDLPVLHDYVLTTSWFDL